MHPGNGGLGLAGRFEQIVGEAFGGDRPGGHEVLPGQIVEVRVETDLRRPLLHLRRPLAGDLRQHRQPSPYVLRPLGVVGGQGGHRVGRHLLAEGVEVGHAGAEDVGLAADLVQAGQREPPVERRVLHTLGHDGTARLLEADDGLRRAVQHLADQRADGGRAGLGGQFDDLGRLGGRRLAGHHVRPVDRHGGEQFAHGDGVAGGRPGQAVDLGAEEQVEHVRLRLLHHRPVFGGLSCHVGGKADQWLFSRRVHEEAVDAVEHLVAGGAVAGPVAGQAFGADEDLLDDRPGAARTLAQPLEVAARIGQPVGVIDAQAVHQPFVEQPEDHLVGGEEHRRVLDPQPDQRRHVEEAPVAGPFTPVDQAIVAGVGVGVLVVAQHVAVDDRLGVVAEHGQRDLPVAPVDVEPLGVRRGGTVLEHRPELGVHRVHVVGHDVHHDAQIVGGELLGHLPEPGGPAELLPDPGVVGDIVAVPRLGRGLEDRRQVDVAHAQVAQVAGDLGHLGETEVGGELQPVGGDGSRHGAAPVRCGRAPRCPRPP